MSGWKSIVGAALLGAAGLHAQAATLTTAITPNSATPGQVVEVDVRIVDVSDLYTYQFALAFDPAVLRVTSVSNGGFLETGGSTFGAPEGAVNNGAGLIEGVFNTLLGPTAGVFGSGNLLHVTFETLAAGTSALNFSGVLFVDSANADIAVTTVSNSITVSAVPEPATWLMLGAGLAGVAALRRRKAAELPA